MNLKFHLQKHGGILLLLFLLLPAEIAQAQELQVKDFKKLERDLIARTHERLDRNDEPCAVVRVSVAKAEKYTFKGNVIGDVTYSAGEALVYMSKGSRRIVIQSGEFGTQTYEFPERLEKSVAYRLELQLVLSEDQKIRTLVMPVAGISNSCSYGIMIGVVKKTGAYLKVKYNFRNLNAAYECDDNGLIAGTSNPSWFTGDSKTSRFAITAGVLQRVRKPLYLYAGVGYGYKKVGWELEGSEWAESTEKSCKGVESEVGGIYRLKNIALSLGVQNNSFKHWEATVGVGIMF